MNKPIFKIIDDKGRVVIPAALRAALGIEKGDVVGITAARGSLAVKKAIVLEDNKMSLEAKEAYVETVMRELPPDKLVSLLELAVRLIQEHN